MNSGYKAKAVHRMADIGEAQLAAMFRRSETDGTDRTLEWLQVVEKCCSGNIEPYYFAVYHQERLVGLLAGIYARKMDFEYESFKGIDSGPVNVIQLNTLLCNFPLSNFHGFFLEEDHRETFFSLFFKEMQDNLEPGGFYFGPVDEEDVEFYQKMVPGEFVRIPYLTLAYMDVEFNGFDQYLDTLKKKYRWDVRNKIKIFQESGARIEYCADSESCAETLLPLFLNTVENNQEIRIPFHFSAQFFEEMSPHLGKRVEIILIKKAETIIAFGLILKKEGMVELKFIGLDYDQSYESAAYFNLFFEVIRLGIKEKAKRIYFGTTGLYNKKRIGCRFMKQCVWMGAYPIKVFAMFKESGLLEKKFMPQDYFAKKED